MRWLAYINRRLERGIETYRREFELQGTTLVDGRAATVHAAKLYKVGQDAILCLPCCNRECNNKHSDTCNERWLESCDPTFTAYAWEGERNES